jgi:hypothetical protein
MFNLTGIEGLSSEMQQCIQNCLECHSYCVATVSHCLEMGGEHASKEHITTLLACAESCQTSANFMVQKHVNAVHKIANGWQMEMSRC